MPEFEPYLLLSAGVFAGAVVSGFAGFAFSAVAGAILLHALPPIEAVPLMMMCSVAVQGISMIALRNTMTWRGSTGFMMGGALGIPPALYLLHHIDVWAFRVGFGTFLATYAAYMFFRPAACLLRMQNRFREIAVGFAGGLVGGLTAMPGALPTIWCDLRGLAKNEQRGLVQPFIAAMQCIALALLIFGNGLSSRMPLYLAVSLPALVAGTALGIVLFRTVDQAAFRRLTLMVLFVGGIALVL